MGNYKYNDALKSKHEETREDTIDKVKEAIQTLKDFEGERTVISATKLAKLTDLSRSVFYKPHVLQIWNYYLWEKRYGHKSNLNGFYEKEINSLKETNELLNQKLQKAEIKIKNLETELKQRKEVYKIDVKELEQKNAEFLGEILTLKSTLRAAGIQYEGL